MTTNAEIIFQDDEILVLFENIFQKYAVDYRQYNLNHLRRRIIHRMSLSNYDSFEDFKIRLLSDSSFLQLFSQDLSIQVTEMFREPEFFVLLKKIVFTDLAKQPEIKVWIAGCSTGEEVYSLAILLLEENLWEKTRIIATDINEDALEIASRGKYANSKLDLFKSNYSACSEKEFDDYFSFNESKIKIDPVFTRKIVFAHHNLVCDQFFKGIDLIICRNVMIYFNLNLQQSIVSKFFNSLNVNGYLCMSKQEDIYDSNMRTRFLLLNQDARIYKKKSE